MWIYNEIYVLVKSTDNIIKKCHPYHMRISLNKEVFVKYEIILYTVKDFVMLWLLYKERYGTR